MIRAHVRFAIIVLLFYCQTAFAEDHNIVTVAGTGSLGDGEPAIAAQLFNPYAITVDTLGNLYIADSNNQRIRKVDTSGFITTVAGTGILGFSGEGGPAVVAQLNVPRNLTVDQFGNLYIADSDNHRVRKVDTSGFITTVAGTGIAGFSGDGGSAIAAQVNSPRGVTVDPLGNLYIADRENNRIRRVDTSGLISTVAGNGTRSFSGDGGPATAAGLRNPTGITFDPAGNLYITDSNNSRVRKVDTSGLITTVAGNGISGFSGDGGPATAARLNFPYGIIVDPLGNLYISDSNNFRVRKVDTSGLITTVGGTGILGFSGDDGPATAAQLSVPYGITMDPLGNLYIADYSNNRVRMIAPSGTIKTVVGDSLLGDGGRAAAAHLRNPLGIAVDPLGNLYIADRDNYRVRKVDTAGFITTVAGTGRAGFSGDGGQATATQLINPTSVAVDRLLNLYIADIDSQRVRKVNTSGFISTAAGTLLQEGFSGDGGPATEAKLNSPNGLALDPLGTLYIDDQGNSRIRKVDTAGFISTVAGTGIAGFSGDGGPAIAAQIRPRGVTADRFGNLFIADVANHRVRKVDTSGFITTVAGNGIAGYSGDGGPAIAAQLSSPSAISVDPLGNLYIADSINHRVRKVDTYGFITSIAGTGIAGFSDDGGSATAAMLSGPRDLTVDQFGNLYIVDANSNRIRRLNVAVPISLGTDTLDIRSKGTKWITAYIEFPSGRDPSAVNLESVMIQAIDPKSGEVRNSLLRGSPKQLIDTDEDHVTDQLKVKFDRSTIASWATGEPELILRVEGQFNDGLYFSGDTSIPVSDSK